MKTDTSHSLSHGRIDVLTFVPIAGGKKDARLPSSGDHSKHDCGQRLSDEGPSPTHAYNSRKRDILSVEVELFKGVFDAQRKFQSAWEEGLLPAPGR